MNRTPRVEIATGRAFALGLGAQFMAVGGVSFVGLVALNVWLTGGALTFGAMMAMGVYATAVMLGWHGLRGFPHATIGLCNIVTVFRLALVSSLIAALISPAASAWWVFAVALVALSLDGVDGWLARRAGHESDFGARFDMEVDAILALVLALHAFWAGQVGAFIVLLGLPRYVFWAAQFAMPWLNAELPDRFSRKVVCVMQIGVLIVVLLPIMGRPLSDVLAGVAAIGLIWSFWKDVLWLWRARP